MNKNLKRYRKLVYGLRFSPEIEVEFPEKVDINNLRTRYRKLLGSWTVTTDTTLNNGLEFKPKNNNKLYYNKECLSEISEVLHIIRKHKGYIDNKTTGGHIHFDASKLNSCEILKILKELMARQEYMVKDFKVESNRLKNTCRLIRPKDIRNLKEKDIEQLRNGEFNLRDIPILNEKYYILNLLNLAELNSLEFRLFQGTLSIKEIKKTVKYIFEFLITALEKK